LISHQFGAHGADTQLRGGKPQIIDPLHAVVRPFVSYRKANPARDTVIIDDIAPHDLRLLSSIFRKIGDVEKIPVPKRLKETYAEIEATRNRARWGR